jgi:hypothetical protein
MPWGMMMELRRRIGRPRHWQKSGWLVLALVALFTGQRAFAANETPSFEDFFPQPTITQAMDTMVGKVFAAGAATGLEKMADPACRTTKDLKLEQFAILGLRIILMVSEAKARANKTGLDPDKADAEYRTAMEPERYKRLKDFSSRLSDPVLNNYWAAAGQRALNGVVGDPLDTVLSALQFAGYPNLGTFANEVFDSPQARAVLFATSDQYDAAFKALSPQDRADMKAHFRISSASLIKGTDMMKANRLSSQDIVGLIGDHLAEHCIGKAN